MTDPARKTSVTHDWTSWRNALEREWGLRMAPGEVERLACLDALLDRWGRGVRLTGFRNRTDRFHQYFLQALFASAWLPDRGHVIDVGSGGGTPALPMALHRPHLTWTLLEPNRKKAVFLAEACNVLVLHGVEVRRSRLEDHEPGQPVHAATARGLALSEKALQRLSTWVEPGGRLLWLTGGGGSSRLEDRAKGSWSLKERVVLPPGEGGHLLVWVRP